MELALKQHSENTYTELHRNKFMTRMIFLCVTEMLFVISYVGKCGDF